MKRLGILSLVAALMLCSCNAQSEEHEQDNEENGPKTDIEVNKEYDEDGNLIRFDSTYTYYYSNIENNEHLADSIIEEFKNRLNVMYPFSGSPYFDDFFFRDTLIRYDFYKSDFFRERYRRNMEYMDQLFWDMDSLKNRFFRKQFPELKADSLEKK